MVTMIGSEDQDFRKYFEFINRIMKEYGIKNIMQVIPYMLEEFDIGESEAEYIVRKYRRGV